MGREDYDVLTRAPGRPFVVELKAPRTRRADLAALAREIDESGRGRVALGAELRYVGPKSIATIKRLDPAKRYRARARADGPLEPERVRQLAAAFTGRTIEQETPVRVLRRRADRVRPRKVLELEAELAGPRELELRLLTEAGTYVKELVSGDGGRTQPSIAGFLGVPTVVVELDVLEVLVSDGELY
jgi:tRNA pseudouridine synthase 10